MCALATVALVLTLFARWYGSGLVISTQGGDLIRSVSAGDAWTVVPGTALIITAASVLVLTGITAAALARSRIALGLTVFGSLAAVVVSAWRATDPATPHVDSPFRLSGDPETSWRIPKPVYPGQAWIRQWRPTARLSLLATRSLGDCEWPIRIQALTAPTLRCSSERLTDRDLHLRRSN